MKASPQPAPRNSLFLHVTYPISSWPEGCKSWVHSKARGTPEHQPMVSQPTGTLQVLHRHRSSTKPVPLAGRAVYLAAAHPVIFWEETHSEDWELTPTLLFSQKAHSTNCSWEYSSHPHIYSEFYILWPHIHHVLMIQSLKETKTKPVLIAGSYILLTTHEEDGQVLCIHHTNSGRLNLKFLDLE